MSLLLLIALSATAGAGAALVVRRLPRSARPVLDAAEAAAEQTPLRRFLAQRRDATKLTGLWLTLALAVFVAGGVILGALALVVRRNSGVVSLDNSVARWGHQHTTGVAGDVIRVITDAGSPTSIAVMAVVLGTVLLVRTRQRVIALFLLCVVGGNALVTTTIKHIVDRVRPSLNPDAATLGPSFPSGHSSHTAAFLAAAALLLGRGRSRRTRALLAGAAVGFAVAVATSRVLLDEHWLSDVVAGLAVGWAWFAVAAIAFGGRLLRFGAAADAASQDARATPPPRTSPSYRQGDTTATFEAPGTREPS